MMVLEVSAKACGQKPRASYGKWAKPLREGHGKTQRFRHSSVSLRPRSDDASPACPGVLTTCVEHHQQLAAAAHEVRVGAVAVRVAVEDAVLRLPDRPHAHLSRRGGSG